MNKSIKKGERDSSKKLLSPFSIHKHYKQETNWKQDGPFYSSNLKQKMTTNEAQKNVGFKEVAVCLTGEEHIKVYLTFKSGYSNLVYKGKLTCFQISFIILLSISQNLNRRHKNYVFHIVPPNSIRLAETHRYASIVHEFLVFTAIMKIKTLYNIFHSNFFQKYWSIHIACTINQCGP